MNKALLFIIFSFLTVSGLHGADSSRVVLQDTVDTQLPELNIVAIKQGAALGNQALSSTTVNLPEIQLDNIADIKSLSDIVPNFYIPVYGSRITSTIYVRGIGARMDQPSVGLTIDNLPVLNKDAYDLDIPDLAEIEMLRGPQSSLYGRNTMTGLINIRTLSPMNFQGLRLYGEASVRKSFRINGGWYHKFRPNMGFSASIGINSIHGDYKNTFNNSETGREKSGNARLKFEWLPNSKLSILNTFASSLLRQAGYSYEYVPTKEINYNDTCFYKRFLINDVLTVNYDFTGWKMSGIVSVQHINDNMTLDQDFLPDSYFNLTQKKQETDLTAELLAQRAPGHAYHWLGGAFFFYRHLDMQAPVTFKNTGIESLIISHRNENNPYYPVKWNSDSFVLNSDFQLPSFGLAAYHESSYSVDGWKFTAALRLDYERVSMHYHSYTDTSYTIYENPSGSLSSTQSEWKSWAEVPVTINDKGVLHLDFLTLLPKVSALYSFNSGLGNVYATFGKGYKAGGYNTNMFSDVLQQKMMNLMGVGSKYDINDIVKYDPEYSFNYEVGAHLDFRQVSASALGRMILDLSLFYIDCRDQQLTMYPDGTTTGRIMTNAGQTRSYGGEISVAWHPADALSCNLSYGYTNARFVKFHNGLEDFKGKRLPYAPSNTLFAQCVYTLSGGCLKNNNIVFDVNLRGVGDIYWNEANTLRQQFYALLGAGVSFKAPRWEVQLWGRNLTGTKYYTFYFMSMGNEFLQRGNKVNAGIILRITI